MDTQPGIDQLLIRSALDSDLQRRLRESPGEVFAEFDLTEEEQDMLRHPDDRLLRLLGAALSRRTSGQAAVSATAPQPVVSMAAQNLSDILLALTIVPCARHENGEFQGFQYVAWVTPIAPGTDPSKLPLPAGATLPGTPSPPLYAVISVSAVQLQDAAGNPQVGLWASMRQSTNVAAPLPASADLESPRVRDAAAAVRNAHPGERYSRILDLLGALRTGEVR